MKPTIFYGQNREDIILSAFLSDVKKGFYVDIGAHHPVDDSVTKYFYERGWRGINIEPQEKQFKELTKDRNRDVNLNIGVADKPGHLTLRSYRSDGLSTFSEDVKSMYETSGSDENIEEYADIEIPVDTLQRIFTQHKADSIHFMKVDVEGFEYEVLKGNDWERFRPEVLCIEANHMKKDWHPFLSKNGYFLAFFDGLNEYFIANEKKYRKELFLESFPKILVTAPLMSHGWFVQFKKLESKLHFANVKLQENTALLEQKNNTNQALESELNFVKAQALSIRFLTKQLLRQLLMRLGIRKR